MSVFIDMPGKLKDRRIKQYYRNQHGFHSKDEYGMRMWANATTRIAQACQCAQSGGTTQ